MKHKPNIQNVTPNTAEAACIREAVVAQSLFVSVDYAEIEKRVMAH